MTLLITAIQAIAALVLVGAGQWAHATGGIPCVTPDKAITLDVQISYSNEAAGSGVMGAILSRRGRQSKTFLKIMHAHANYKRHTLRLKAQSETAEREPMRLNIHRSAATLRLGSQRHKLICDWSEFS